MVHFHIEKAGKLYGTTWNKPKDTGRLQGDNFESGTLELQKMIMN